MRLKTWIHGHLQCIAFVFDRGWRRHSRQWCIHQLFAGHFQDDGAYHKWRVILTILQIGGLRRLGPRDQARARGRRRVGVETLENQDIAAAALETRVVAEMKWLYDGAIARLE